ncbi:6-phosphogluconate dehydrogenase [Nonlabens dokdonensis]|uniref:6-phosphogluconate dehydrogenase n=1 Tax=Nonlabens dokdonensis TaxID=328515 RepID=A0A1Z8B7G5_9FLAO|nr:6-phosphogluconate dehydrogenase [Nonlabens dokdonensis]OUS18428.1 6-phosphogluconate dehydrogenase [Nonlabens dokdonensis]
MKKILGVILATILIMMVLWYAFIYFASYSEGYRSGELIKFSSKGFVVKTWEGEISQGISGAQIFSFSVMNNQPEVIEALKEYQGEYVKLKYEEKFGTFFFWGDTKYFITEVTPEKSPHFNRD